MPSAVLPRGGDRRMPTARDQQAPPLHVFRGALLLGDVINPVISAFGVQGRWQQRCPDEVWQVVAADAVDGRISVDLGTSGPAMRAKMSATVGAGVDLMVDLDLG